MASRPQGPLGIFEAGEALFEHTAKAIKILEGALSARVPPPEPMMGDCDNCGHSFMYHAPLFGCVKCNCGEFV